MKTIKGLKMDGGMIKNHLFHLMHLHKITSKKL